MFLLKRIIFTALFCIFSLIFASCSEIATLKPAVKRIGFTAQTEWEGEKYEITAETDGEMNVFFTFKSPERIKDTKLSFSGDFVTYYYLELEEKFLINDFPLDTPCNIIYTCLKDASKENALVKQAENLYYTESRIENENYKLSLGGSGLPIKISNKENNIYFKGVTLLN